MASLRDDVLAAARAAAAAANGSAAMMTTSPSMQMAPVASSAHPPAAAIGSAPTAASVAASAATSAALGASSGKRKKQAKKGATLDSRLVSQCRQGYTRLINVREFVSRYSDLQAKLTATCAMLGRAGESPDLSIDDLAVPTPFQAVDKAIHVEVARVTAFHEEEKKAAAERQLEQQTTNQQRLIEQAAMNHARQLAYQFSIHQQPQQQQLQQHHPQQQQHHHGDETDHGRMQSDAEQVHRHDATQGAPHADLHLGQQRGAHDTDTRMGESHHTHGHDGVHHDGHEQHAPASSGAHVESQAHDHRANLRHEAAAATSSAAAASQHLPLAAAAVGSADSSHQLDVLPAAAASSAQDGPHAMMDDTTSRQPGPTSSAMASAAIYASAAQPSSAEQQDDPPDFGLNIPNFDALVQPLLPLQKHRQKMAVKRARADNCMTTKAFEHDYKSRAGSGPAVPLPANEAILRVAVYHPTNFTKTQEFLVCGSQPLTALRDRIYCLHDHTLDGPHTPSAFFFIENKFYNDMRDRRAISLADTILEWVKAESRYNQPGLAHFEQCDMHATTFQQLSIRLGSHYNYQHQGSCNHTIVFTQLRMSHASDVQNMLAYPLKPFQCKTKRRKCRVCDLYPAAYVTYGDKLANENPFFYCEECYRPLHYSFQGNLLYNDFQVYSYDHD